MQFYRFLTFTLHLAILACVFVPYASADSLQFNVKGTFDTPSGIYPLAGPSFALTFNIPSDPGPGDLIFYPLAPVALYTTAIYTNNGVATPPLANTYVVFDSELNGGGIYIFLSPSDLLPLGLAIEFVRGNIPQLYSGTFVAPHFAPGTVDLDLALQRAANQGAGNPLSSISNGVLTITPVPEPSTLVSLSASAILLAWHVRKRNPRVTQTSSFIN
jgi:hypothetical protein